MLENGLGEQHAKQQKHRVTEHMLQKVLPALITTEADSVMAKQPQPTAVLENDNIFDEFAVAILEGCKDLDLKKVNSIEIYKETINCI